ncbi:MAG: hypothetical protein JWN00_3046 [Actinomycetia bacterium]|nr:hypothetical protein [Actinomycetes bacterium]
MTINITIPRLALPATPLDLEEHPSQVIHPCSTTLEAVS